MALFMTVSAIRYFPRNPLRVFVLFAVMHTSSWGTPVDNPAVVPTARGTTFAALADGLVRLQYKFFGPNVAEVDTVFVGDSITDQWQSSGKVYWRKSFSEALNFAVGGDRTEHVLHRLQSKADGGQGWFQDEALQPSRIILMLGINNLYLHDVEQTVGGVEAVIKRLRELRPEAEVLLCSVLPTIHKDKNAELVIPVNRALQHIEGVKWLDMYPLYLQADGITQNRALFRDSLHLNTQGYAVWHKALLSHVVSMERR